MICKASWIGVNPVPLRRFAPWSIGNWRIGSVGGGKWHYAVGSKQQSNTGRYELLCEMNLAAYRKLFAIPLVLLADSWLLGSP